MPKTYLNTRVTEIVKASFPVIDAHNHLWDGRDFGRIMETMDTVGVVAFFNLTGNLEIVFGEGGYSVGPGDIAGLIGESNAACRGRFYHYTMAGFARPADRPLFTDADHFVAECLETLRAHVGLGARGLKVMKELGLHHRDAGGALIPVDDPRLFPIWEEAGRLRVPVLIHQADPTGFFEPVTEENEHFGSLAKYPSWSFADPGFPRKKELLDRRDNLVRQHRGTTFILPHVANHAEDLAYVSDLLDENPNIYIDFSARLDELGRQPYTTRELFIRHQDRILFGTDMPAGGSCSVDMYRTYFRFLETYDEAFFSPDYDGTFDRARWPICGIGLPEAVLEKIYYKNILKIIPELSVELKEYLPKQ